MDVLQQGERGVYNMRKIKIYPDWYGKNQPKLYKKRSIDLKPGVTVLVGCNGAGKTTLMNQIRANLTEKHIPFTGYDNLVHGRENALDDASFNGDFTFLATAIQSSEGENIVMNLGTFAKKLGAKVNELTKKKIPELWIFVDAADSGMSIDNVVYLKKLLHHVEEDCTMNQIEVYIIISANTYEVARKEQCFDVMSGTYVTFSDYEAYREHILKTADMKENREKPAQNVRRRKP